MSFQVKQKGAELRKIKLTKLAQFISGRAR